MMLSDLTWPAVDALSRDLPMVFPVAALEQHGRHLPLFTDSLLLGEIVRRVAGTLRDEAVFAPMMWLGNSDHHLDFAGTLSAPPRVYLDLLNGLAENALTHGFRRIVFLNGHGGNDVPGRQAVFELRQRHREGPGVLFLCGTYWGLGSAAPEGLEQREMGHACEWETSMMLRLSPHLVGDHLAVEPVVSPTSFAGAGRGWITRERSEAGHIGLAHRANAAKGEALFARFAEDVTSFLRRVAAWDGRSWNG